MNKHDHGLTHFHFALPANASLSEAEAHIDTTFGITGEAEPVRSELAFTLYRIEVQS